MEHATPTSYPQGPLPLEFHNTRVGKVDVEVLSSANRVPTPGCIVSANQEQDPKIPTPLVVKGVINQGTKQ
jgi:hypothetical protein